MRKFSVLLTALFLIGVSAVFGQGRSISGKVLDSESGDPIIGAAVEVVGAQTGTSTDENGDFTVTLPEGYNTLRFTQTSYKSQDLTARDGMVVRLVLDSEVLATAEIQVAMGTKMGKGYVGAAQTVTSETIEKKSPTDVTKALAGEFAGVQIATTTGQPGVASSVRIRGTASLNAGGGVLYVVDGVPYGSDISAIDPSDIVSTTVLKDATATSMYGARGSNGVILITTKKGTAGSEGKIEVDAKFGANLRLLPMHDVITSPEQYMEMSWLGLYNTAVQVLGANHAAAGSWANSQLFGRLGMTSNYNLWKTTSIIDPNTGKFIDGVEKIYEPESWKDHIFHVGKKYDFGIKMSGGSDKTTYYTSVNFTNDEGYYIQSDFKRLSALSNIDYSPKKWINANFKMQYAYFTMNDVGQSSTAANNGFYFVNSIPPIYPVFQHNADGSIVYDPYTGGNKYDFGQYVGYVRPFQPGTNPAGALRLDRSYSQAHNVALSNVLKFEFIKDLVITITNGYNFLYSKSMELDNYYNGDAEGVGRIAEINQTYLDFTTHQQISYRKTFGDVHNFDAMLGHNFRNQEQGISESHKAQLMKPYDLSLSNAVQMVAIADSYGDYRAESYMGEFRYNFDEKYFLLANGSVYGSSYFDKGHKYGVFAALGASWNVHRETFMATTRKWLNNLKIKASFGTTGNDQIGNYNYYDMYNIYNFDNQPGILWNSKAEPSLTWETSYKFNAGIEFEIKKGKLYGEIEFYNDHVVHLLDTRTVAPSIGYGSIPVNQGRFRNYGVELLLKSNLIKTRNFDLNLRLTASHNNTKVLELPKELINGVWVEMTMNGAYAKGYEVDAIYTAQYLGVNPENGWALWRAYLNQAGDYILQPYVNKNQKTVKDGQIVPKYEEREFIETVTSDANKAAVDFIGKKRRPDVYGGFGFDISTYGFDFSAMFNFNIGGYNYDYIYRNLMADNRVGSFNMHKDVLNAWSPFATSEHNSSTSVPVRLSGFYAADANGKIGYRAGHASRLSDRFLISNTGLRLANVRIAYNFPKKMLDKIKLNNLSVWVMGDNLFVLSHRQGYNPFMYLSGGSTASAYAPVSTVMGGVKFSF